MQTIQIDSGKIKTVPNKEIVRLSIHYPAGAHVVSYHPDDHINGRQFLTELLAFGWVPGAVIGRTLHLIHPAAEYVEA